MPSNNSRTAARVVFYVPTSWILEDYAKQKHKTQSLGCQYVCEVSDAIAEVGCWIYFAGSLAMRLAKVNGNPIQFSTRAYRYIL